MSCPLEVVVLSSLSGCRTAHITMHMRFPEISCWQCQTIGASGRRTREGDSVPGEGVGAWLHWVPSPQEAAEAWVHSAEHLILRDMKALSRSCDERLCITSTTCNMI